MHLFQYFDDGRGVNDPHSFNIFKWFENDPDRYWDRVDCALLLKSVEIGCSDFKVGTKANEDVVIISRVIWAPSWARVATTGEIGLSKVLEIGR